MTHTCNYVLRFDTVNGAVYCATPTPTGFCPQHTVTIAEQIDFTDPVHLVEGPAFGDPTS